MELGKYILFYVIQSEFITGYIFASENKAIVLVYIASISKTHSKFFLNT